MEPHFLFLDILNILVVDLIIRQIYVRCVKSAYVIKILHANQCNFKLPYILLTDKTGVISKVGDFAVF